MAISSLALLVGIVSITVLVITVSRRGRSTESSPDAMSSRTKWIAGVVLGALVLGIGGTITMIGTMPARPTYETELTVQCDGARIYLGGELAGEDRVSLPITGEEPFLVPLPSTEPDAEMLGLAILKTAPGGQPLDPIPTVDWSHQVAHRIQSLGPIRLQRSDGSIDSVLPIAMLIGERAFILLVRARRGADYELKPWGSGGSGSRTASGPFNRDVVSRKTQEVRLRLKPREDDGTVAWLDRFPEDAATLREKP